MRLKTIPSISIISLLIFPLAGLGAELGTRQRTIRPVALATNTPVIFPSDAADYAVYGYSAWQWGPGVDEGQQLTNMPAGYGGPLGHQVAIDRDGTGVTINFLGKLQAADTLSGLWNDVTGISPYTVSAKAAAKFYRATE